MTANPGDEREGRVVTTVPEDSYANRLVLARAHAGHLSQRAAADRCGLNDANWANWERGMRSRTMVEDAEAIADGLGIDLQWLLHGGPLTRPPRRTRTFNRSYRKRNLIAPGRSDDRRPRRLDRARRAAA